MENGAATSIGNYKGVMLCNRPFAGVGVTNIKKNQSKSSTDRVPFLTGGCSSTIGQNVPILDKPAYAVNRDKKNTALSKHKKWLYELKMERSRLQELLQDEESRKERQRKRFQAREAKMRAIVRSGLNNMKNDSLNNDNNKANRPMWALTSDDADKEVERQEDEEADNLIDFANKLDIDEFMEKVENKELLNQINKKVDQLEKEVEDEEDAERKSKLLESLQNEKKLVPLNAENLASFNDEEEKCKKDDDLVSIASNALSECKSIRSVHSSKSIAILTKRAKEKIKNLESIPETNDFLHPVIVCHEDEERIKIKKHPSNLPYMHRNPSI